MKRRSFAPFQLGATIANGGPYISSMAQKQRHQPSPDDILTSPTAAKVAGLERVYFARLIREGKGPKHQRVTAGTRTLVLIRRGDLDAWIASRKG